MISAAGRKVIECELVNNDGRYEMDFDTYDAQMDGSAKMLLPCSPHNPGGRVWTRAELEGVAEFAQRHNLIIVSDEIHHDLVMPDHTHISMNKIDGIDDRLVMMTAASKTFSIAGSHIGNVIISDPALRKTFAARLGDLGMYLNSFGLFAVAAAYSPNGAAWVDQLTGYLDDNRKVFDAAVNAIPGLKSMPLEATYLSWVDFSGTAMEHAEIIRLVEQDAKIAANHGDSFCKGGENFMRFNLGTRAHGSSRLWSACNRHSAIFSDVGPSVCERIAEPASTVGSKCLPEPTQERRRI